VGAEVPGDLLALLDSAFDAELVQEGRAPLDHQGWTVLILRPDPELHRG
jgi:hypothetical protein